MTEEKSVYTSGNVESTILTIRGQKVILDSDLAGIYGVSTKALNQAVKRNAERFPADFMFQLTAQEAQNMRSQIVTADLQTIGNKDDRMNWSQIVTSSNKHRGAKYRPFAFTEHGAIMAATVLNSPKAVQMSVFVVHSHAAGINVAQRDGEEAGSDRKDTSCA